MKTKGNKSLCRNYSYIIFHVTHKMKIMGYESSGNVLHGKSPLYSVISQIMTPRLVYSSNRVAHGL